MGEALALLAWVLVGGATALWFRRIREVRIPADRRGFVACWLAGAALGLLALILGPGWAGGVGAVLALVAGGFFTALVAISPQKVAANAIRVGERLREFAAPDEQGREFSLQSLAGRPLLLKFFRGHW